MQAISSVSFSFCLGRELYYCVLTVIHVTDGCRFYKKQLVDFRYVFIIPCPLWSEMRRRRNYFYHTFAQECQMFSLAFLSLKI